MAESLRGQDHLYTLIERDSDGASVRVIGSIVDYVSGDWQRRSASLDCWRIPNWRFFR